jgi:hypothetical protein
MLRLIFVTILAGVGVLAAEKDKGYLKDAKALLKN